VLFQAEVLCTYAAVVAGEIDAKRGDYINVVGTDGPHYICECNGVGGKFPIGLCKKIAGTEKGVPTHLLAAAEAKAFKPGIEALPPNSNYARAQPVMPPNYLPETQAAGLNRALAGPPLQRASSIGTPNYANASPTPPAPSSAATRTSSGGAAPYQMERRASDVMQQQQQQPQQQQPQQQQQPPLQQRPTSMFAPAKAGSADARPPLSSSAERSPTMAPARMPTPARLPAPARSPTPMPSPPQPAPAWSPMSPALSQQLSQPVAARSPTLAPRQASPPVQQQPAMARPPARTSGLRVDATALAESPATPPILARPPSRSTPVPLTTPSTPPALVTQTSGSSSIESAGSLSNGSAGSASLLFASPAAAATTAAAPLAGGGTPIDAKKRCQVCDVKAAVAKVTMASGTQLKMCHDCIEKERERKKQLTGAAPPATAGVFPNSLPMPSASMPEPPPAFEQPVPPPFEQPEFVPPPFEQPEFVPPPFEQSDFMPAPFEQPPAYESQAPYETYDQGGYGDQAPFDAPPAPFAEHNDEWNDDAADAWNAAPAPPESEHQTWDDDAPAAPDAPDLDNTFATIAAELDNMNF
jgi:hypothetical protein